MSLEILDPTHEGDSGSFALASRLSALDGATVGIISNGKKNTIPFFKQCHCGGTSHLVALSGAHTLGHAHSRHVTDWCVEESLPNTENARNMDTTPGVFDNTYWKHVTRAECPRHRKRANHYDRCTAPYLADSYAQETWPRLQPTKQDCGEPYAWNNTNDALFFDRWGDTCDPREGRGCVAHPKPVSQHRNQVEQERGEGSVLSDLHEERQKLYGSLYEAPGVPAARVIDDAVRQANTALDCPKEVTEQQNRH